MPITVQGKTYLNTKEAAKRHRVSFTTIAKLIEQQNIKRYKFAGRGPSVYYLIEDIDTLFEGPLEVDDQEEPAIA